MLKSKKGMFFMELIKAPLTFQKLPLISPTEWRTSRGSSKDGPSGSQNNCTADKGVCLESSKTKISPRCPT